MLYQYLVLVLVWSSLFSLTTQHIGCLRNEITILSTNTTLLPLTSITALQADQPEYPVEDIVSRGPGKLWCTTGNGINYVNMTFSQPVVVESIFHQGAISLPLHVEHYVSSFSILYSSTEDGPLQLYPTNFIATSPVLVYKFTESITVLKLQFRINSYIANPEYCLQVDIYGCTLDNVVQLMCSLTQSQEALPSPTSIQQDPLPTYTAAEVQFHTPTSPHVTTVILQPSCGSESSPGSQQGSALTSAHVTTVTLQPSCGSESGQSGSQQGSAPTSAHVTTDTLQPSCGSESGQSGSQQGSAAGILVAGTAVLVVGVVLMVSAIVLCATVAVIRKRIYICRSGDIGAQRWTINQPNSTSASMDHETSPNTHYGTDGITNTSDDSQDNASVMPYEQPIQTTPNLCYVTIGQKHETDICSFN